MSQVTGPIIATTLVLLAGFRAGGFSSAASPASFTRQFAVTTFHRGAAVRPQRTDPEPRPVRDPV